MRDPKERLKDILEAIAAIERYLNRGRGRLRGGRAVAAPSPALRADHRRSGTGLSRQTPQSS